MVKEPKAQEVKTNAQIEAMLDEFSNAHIVEIESLVPARYAMGKACFDEAAPPPVLDALYFCIPHNDKLLESWDLVADRLFNGEFVVMIGFVVAGRPAMGVLAAPTTGQAHRLSRSGYRVAARDPGVEWAAPRRRVARRSSRRMSARPIRL